MTHVIGDRALNQTLDWYEEAWSDLDPSDWQTDDIRWRVEHAQIFRPQIKAVARDVGTPLNTAITR